MNSTSSHYIHFGAKLINALQPDLLRNAAVIAAIVAVVVTLVLFNF